MWNEEKSLTAFSCGDINQLSLPVKVICIWGLTDGFNACPWISPLASVCQENGWNLLQPLLSSSYQGYGTGSLVRDTIELTYFIEHLVSNHSCEQVVLVGHSTGCQNCVHFLRHAPSSVKCRIVAVALQAPVSDQEAGEMEENQEEYLRHAREEVSIYGESACEKILMPMHMHYSPITVSRFMALFERYGADDMFSSYLTDEELIERLGHFTECASLHPSSLFYADNGIPVLVAYSEADEYVPASVDKLTLVSRLARALGPAAKELLIDKANHNLSIPADGSAIKIFIEHLVKLIDDRLKKLN